MGHHRVNLDYLTASGGSVPGTRTNRQQGTPERLDDWIGALSRNQAQVTNFLQ
jgi:hypothetical protein